MVDLLSLFFNSILLNNYKHHRLFMFFQNKTFTKFLIVYIYCNIEVKSKIENFINSLLK